MPLAFNRITDVNCNCISLWLYYIFQYMCCGVNNYTDWYGVYDIHNYKNIPDSCCGYMGCGQAGGKVAYIIVSTIYKLPQTRLFLPGRKDSVIS